MYYKVKIQEKQPMKTPFWMFFQQFNNNLSAIKLGHIHEISKIPANKILKPEIRFDGELTADNPDRWLLRSA